MLYKKGLSLLLGIVIFQSCSSAAAEDLKLSSTDAAVDGSSPRHLASIMTRPNKAGKSTKSSTRKEDDMNSLSAQYTEYKIPLAESYLIEGDLKSGEKKLLEYLDKNKNDDQNRFGLGVMQFLQAVEGLCQDLYRYGLSDRSQSGGGIGLLRIKLARNPHPEKISYLKCRSIAEKFLNSLSKAEATLASVSDSEVKLPLHFGMIKLDISGNGRFDENARLWKLYANLSRNHSINAEEAQKFKICFDKGDVHWLRGYCNLIMAFCQIYLAYDSQELFDCTAQLFFPDVDSPYPYLSKGKHVRSLGRSDFDIADIIAFIHLLRFNIVEPARMESSLHHLELVVSESKSMWKSIMTETDDDCEWIPNPKQTGVIPGVRVSEEMVEAWTALMDKIGQILKGDLLIAFWRGDSPQGVNLRRVFLEPRKLDLVLWIQGSAAAPYLEDGKCTKIETWRSLQSAFGSNFPGFAIWFN